MVRDMIIPGPTYRYSFCMFSETTGIIRSSPSTHYSVYIRHSRPLFPTPYTRENPYHWVFREYLHCKLISRLPLLCNYLKIDRDWDEFFVLWPLFLKGNIGPANSDQSWFYWLGFWSRSGVRSNIRVTVRSTLRIVVVLTTINRTVVGLLRYFPVCPSTARPRPFKWRVKTFLYLYEGKWKFQVGEAISLGYKIGWGISSTEHSERGRRLKVPVVYFGRDELWVKVKIHNRNTVVYPFLE